ncbi:unnamed protein product [Effrenium voratum]|uniref:Enoyl-CoA hydratase n=1 Tax=Effrenium voratum TaxID=2562239 RepID=A0AA36MXB9_9DINO|nr:unnamed protein product [Effrenium voratum]
MKGQVLCEKRTASDGSCVAVLTMDNKPVNALSAGVRVGLEKQLQELTADSSVKAAVLSGGPGVFCGGADISEFATGVEGPSLTDIIAAIENSEKPVVAAIDGVSLGGGYEVALGCHWRLASSRAQAGLPEVNLGILPGAGGTQRLPRLIGAEKSVDFICRGTPMKAQKAVQLGLYDQLVDGDYSSLLQAAVEFAAKAAGQDLTLRRLGRGKAKAAELSQKRQEYAKSRKGELAPQAIISCVEAAVAQDFQDAMKVEFSEFCKLMVGPQAQALQYMFFAQRQCQKVPGLDKAAAPGTCGIVGAGLMGSGIAMCCAENGIKVVLLDIDQKNLDRGMTAIKKNYARSVERKSKSQAQVDGLLASITPSTSYDSLGHCDIVVEAVFENMDLKRKIFAELDRVCKPGCVLASNTSGLNIDSIAEATKRPQDVVGCHFFSPANVMPLLENVRGPRTAPQVMAKAMAFGAKLKKVTCLVGNCPGFIANRVMNVSGWTHLIQGGLLPHQIDAAAEAFGMRMGPTRMMDLVGLDLFGRERERKGEQDDQNEYERFQKLLAEEVGPGNPHGWEIKSDWAKDYSKQQFKMRVSLRSHESGNPNKLLRGDGKYKGVVPEDFLGFLLKPELPGMKEWKDVETLPDGFIKYCRVKAPCMTPRDHCWKYTIDRRADGSIFVCIRTTTHPECPEKPGIIRAYYYNSCVFKMSETEEGVMEMTEFIFQDLKGGLPVSLMNAALPKGTLEANKAEMKTLLAKKSSDAQTQAPNTLPA